MKNNLPLLSRFYIFFSSDQILSIGMFIAGRVVKSGGRIHYRNERHRAWINTINCARIVFEINNSNKDVAGGIFGTLGCAFNYLDQKR